MEVINSNLWVVQFLRQNWMSLLIAVLLLIPLFPPEWFNYEDMFYFQNRDGSVYKMQKRIRVTILQAVLRLLVLSIMTLTDFLLPLVAYFGFKDIISLLIFVVVGCDIFFTHHITTQVVVLVSIALIILYTDQLVEKGRKVSFFGRLLEWEKDSYHPTEIMHPQETSAHVSREKPRRKYVKRT